MASRTITIRSTASRRQIEAYLYSSATLLTEEPNPEGQGRIYTVRVEAPEDRVAYAAQYQADRLSSGWHFARVEEA